MREVRGKKGELPCRQQPPHQRPYRRRVNNLGIGTVLQDVVRQPVWGEHLELHLETAVRQRARVRAPSCGAAERRVVRAHASVRGARGKGSLHSTVTATPRNSVANGTARHSSIIV